MTMRRGVVILSSAAAETYGVFRVMTSGESEGVGPLVTTDWLETHLHDPDLRVVDIRGYVTTRPLAPGVEEATYKGAPEEYRAGHVPGAVYVDWTRDIVDLDDPIPAQIAPAQEFARIMSERGIGDNTR